MTDAGMRVIITVVFGAVCIVGLICTGIILDDMVRRSGWSVPGVVFSFLELVISGICGLLVWMAHHD